MIELPLTEEQRRVVEAPIDGPHLVNAGAGTGKTYTLVARTVHLVRAGVDPRALLLITFTNAAAAEITTRIDAAFGVLEPRRPTCGTFHSVAAGLLREFAYETGTSPDIRVIDDGRARALFRRVFEEMRQGTLGLDLSAFPLLDRPDILERDLAGLALRFKQIGLTPDAFEQQALAHAADLERITFGGVKQLRNDGAPRSGWPKPNPERTEEERRDEADRERRNARVVAGLLRRFDSLLEAEALLTFGDVLRRAIAMLDAHPKIRETLQARWQHAIVDEFQDTNPTQIDFLKAIFGPEFRRVLAVGDVRQGIYEFNGADPHGIIKFGNLPDCITLPLTENRRSVQPILDVAHSTLTGGRGGVPENLHQLLTAHRGHAEAHTVRFEIFEGPDPLQEETSAVAAAIRRLVDDGASPRDCAVLLRTRTRAAAYAKALWDRGLAVQLDGGVGFFDAQEVREVLAWLKLVETPDDEFAITGALQSAGIGLGDGAVTHLAAHKTLARSALVDTIPQDFNAAERERLERFREIARQVCALADVPLVEALRSIVNASGAALARANEGGRYDQASANLEKLIRLAAELAQDRPLARVRDFVAELAIRDELEMDLPPAELEGDRITISTIHGAKGKEWPYVFVANVSPATFPLQNSGKGDVVAMYDEAQETFALKHAIDGRPTLRWYMLTNAHDGNGIVSSERGSTDYAEEFRLLYVALTRARDAVYVSGRRVHNRRRSQCADAVSSWLTGCGYDLEQHRLPPHPAADVTAAEANIDAVMIEEALAARLARIEMADRAHPQRLGALSYSAMELQERCPRRARYHYVLGLPDLTDEAPTLRDAGATSDLIEAPEPRDPARYGRIVHRVLEYDMQARLAGSDRDLAQFTADAVAEEEGTEEEESAALGAAKSASPLLERFSPVDVERRFTITIDGVTLGGYIDLLARDEKGRLVVVDYKTGRTPAEHYALQFALYAAAVTEEFGEVPRVLLLRIGDETATEEAPEPATEAALRAAIATANTMESDEPRPGTGCTFCPYAHDVCRAAPAALTSA